MPFMVPNVMRNLFTKPATRPYPFQEPKNFPGTRGEVVFYEDKCCYCGMCARGCPANAITMRGSRKHGDITLGYNPFACIYCGKCVEMCPCCAVVMFERHAQPSYKKVTHFREDQPV